MPSMQTHPNLTRNLPGALGSLRSLTGFGQDYEHHVSKTQARRLFGNNIELPAMGYELVVRKNYEQTGPVGRFLTGQLALQNIAGALFLASSTHPVATWSTVFGVQVLEPTPEKSRGRSRFLRRTARTTVTNQERQA